MHHWMFFPFGFLFFLILMGFFVTNIVMWRKRRWGCYGNPNPNTPHLILDKRLASGEIDIEEYKKLKDILKD